MNFNKEAITFQSIIGRQPRSIIFDTDEISKLRDERILVTGAGGSIGSQIIKLVSKHNRPLYNLLNRNKMQRGLSMQLECDRPLRKLHVREEFLGRTKASTAAYSCLFRSGDKF